MIAAALLLLVAQTGAAPLVELPKAFVEALKFDEAAYYQICGDAARRRTFRALQERAESLAVRYWHERESDAQAIYYVDRRAGGRCFSPKHFEKTARDWKSALDQIELAMGRAH